MRYESLIDAHRQFLDDPRLKSEAEWKAYQDALTIDWDKLSESSQMGALFRFLNSWGKCRIKPSEKEKLLDRFCEARPFLEGLRNVKWTHELTILQEIGAEKTTLQRAIHISFDLLAHKGPARFAHVATSKLLHAYNPDLLVPWDDAIIKHSRKHGLDLKSDGYSYASEFLPYVIRQGEDAIKSYVDKHRSLSRGRAIEAIEREAHVGAGEKTVRVKFTKLLDEYNYLEAHGQEANVRTE